jgi:predicted DNA-binding protein (MmcQ/YjbR family)
MDFSSAQKCLLSKHQAKENFPFGPEVAVYKVCHKMFATLTNEAGQVRVNLKCDPEQAVVLREKFPAVHPGHHMNKKHWNTVFLDGTVPDGEIQRMIDHSYELVINNLPSDEQARLRASQA